MVGRIERDLGDALEGLDPDRAGERHVRRVGGADHPRMLDLQLGLGAQPVVVVVLADDELDVGRGQRR